MASDSIWKRFLGRFGAGKAAAEHGCGAGEQVRAAEETLVTPVETREQIEPIEKLQAGFDHLIEKLEAINQGLARHASQNAELAQQLGELPNLMTDLPDSIRKQEQVGREMLEQLRANAAAQSQLREVMEKLPAEAAAQSETLAGIHRQLAADAEADAMRAEGFNRFNDTLDRLNQSSESQTDSIMQMSRTFATSDRYLKYIISRQNKRFMWLFTGTLAVCVAVILIFAGVIMYLKN
jgi:chromosome segregation ATPase